jgi:hypothetical protein
MTSDLARPCQTREKTTVLAITKRSIGRIARPAERSDGSTSNFAAATARWAAKRLLHLTRAKKSVRHTPVDGPLYEADSHHVNLV